MVGDVYKVFGAAVANDAALTVQPVAGREVVIHNVYHPSTIELMVVVGANELAFHDEAGKSVVTNMYFHLTNTQYLKVYNRSGAAAADLAVDGVVTKEA